MSDRPLVLVAANRKGGCSKSTSVLSLAGAATSREMLTLIVDMDPQGSLTQCLAGVSAYERISDRESVAALFDDTLEGDPRALIQATKFPNLFLAPASDGLGRFNHADPSAHGWLQDSVRQFIAEVGATFDVVLIDTPPNLQLLTHAAMVAADYCYSPLTPEDFSAQGLVHVRRFIQQVQTTRNPTLHWIGVLLSCVQPRLGVHIAYEKVIRDAYGDLVFKTVIPLAAPIKEAIANRTPITLYKPRVAGAKLYQQLFDEILTRVDAPLMATQEAA